VCSIWQYLDIPAASSGDHASPHWGYAKGEDWAAESDKWEECSSGDQQVRNRIDNFFLAQININWTGPSVSINSGFWGLGFSVRV
jgi:hypothetical protein